MTMRSRIGPGWGTVLIITACWTLVLAVVYVNNYMLIGDLLRSGKLSGEYAFWPDLAGNTVLGVFGGLLGGFLLVFKVNAGYRQRTFLSGILVAAGLFVAAYIGFALVSLFGMGFVFFAVQDGLAAAAAPAWANVIENIATPSFAVSGIVWAGIVAGTQFMLQVNEKFGPGVLWKFLTGRYYHPREEERVFMFLDLTGSTRIAERLGHRSFFELLRDLYRDLTPSVVAHGGEIYQYVGDEVVITWEVPRAVEDADCVRCFFAIRAALESRDGHYQARYGVRPVFKAGLHVGESTVGEIGVIKKDIVYSGDALNTTARIRAECAGRDTDLLVSAELLDRVRLGGGLEAVPIGEIALRGKVQSVSLHSVIAA